MPVGNFGSAGNDPPADPCYTCVRLGPAGRLALAAERGEVGPVPLGLVEGSFWRDGPVPPFAPAAVLAALRDRTADAGPPVLPTGGVVEGYLTTLLAGGTARFRLSCTVVRERQQHGDVLVVTEVPLGSNPDEVMSSIASRVDSDVAQSLEPPGRHGTGLVHPFVRDLRDETTSRVGTRILVVLRRGADPVDALGWLKDVWPFRVDVDWRLPAPQPERLNRWDAGDGSGLEAFATLLRVAAG